MKKISQLLLLFVFSNTFSQPMSVPYKVGNLFGLSNEKGKMIINPQFDILEVSSYNDLYFTGYNLSDNRLTSSLIYKDKIILLNKEYNTYDNENELFRAKKYVLNPKKDNFSVDKVKQIVHLYDNKGNPIIKEDCKYIGILESNNATNISNEVLIYYETANENTSLLIYNKKQKKITKYFFQNVNLIEVSGNQYYNPNDKSTTFIYLDKNQKGKKLTLLEEPKGIKTVSEVDFEYIMTKGMESNSYDDVRVPGSEYKKKQLINSSNDSIIESIKSIQVAREFYYNTKKVEKIKVDTEKLNLEYSYIIKKNDKVGLKLTKDNKIIIPIDYDEIFLTEMSGLNSCYLVKKGHKYGAQINAYNVENSFEIEPVFNNMFLVSNLNYFGLNNPLLKIYDENASFYCYAKKDGTLFAK